MHFVVTPYFKKLFEEIRIFCILVTKHKHLIGCEAYIKLTTCTLKVSILSRCGGATILFETGKSTVKAANKNLITLYLKKLN